MIAPAEDSDVLCVLMRLRESNAREIFARRPVDDSEAARAALADQLNRAAPAMLERWCFRAKDLTPVAIVTLHLSKPGTAVFFMATTDRWIEVARTVYRFGHRLLYKRGLSGIQRCETRVIEGSDIRWLLRLGFVVEGLDPPAGKRGENFLRLGWTRPGAFDV